MWPAQSVLANLSAPLPKAVDHLKAGRGLLQPGDLLCRPLLPQSQTKPGRRSDIG